MYTYMIIYDGLAGSNAEIAPKERNQFLVSTPNPYSIAGVQSSTI